VKKTTLNAIVDTIAFFPLLVTAVTGIIIWLYLPRGTQLAAFGTVLSHQTFLGIQRQIWLDVHTYLGLVFTALVAIHLILHWSYIKRLPQRFAKTEPKKDYSMKRFLALLLIGVVIVAVVIIAAYASNTAPSSSSPTTSSGSIANATTSRTASSVPSQSATANPSSIPTSIDGHDYIYYHELNDRSTCILCHSDM
jgi:nicotinamide riboside transporter PnuC